MSNAYYGTGEERARKVQALFARIAGRYDLLNDLQTLGLHRRWKRLAADWTGAGQGSVVLDLCCGTGDLARLFAARGAQVVAADFSFPMLQKASPKGGQISWAQADALHLPFPDITFDVVAVGYGLRNVADLSRALQEIARVLKPGGCLVSLDFGQPTNAFWRRLYFLYLATVTPIVGFLFAGSASAYAYILESLRKFPDPPALAARFESAGLVQAEVRPLATGTMALVRALKPPNR